MQRLQVSMPTSINLKIIAQHTRSTFSRCAITQRSTQPNCLRFLTLLHSFKPNFISLNPTVMPIFFRRVNDFSNLMAAGYTSLNTRPASPCTVSVTSEDLLPPQSNTESRLNHNDRFHILCLVAGMSHR